MSERDLQAAAHLLDVGRATEAEQMARAHLASDPQSAQALGLLTEALNDQERWSEAVASGRAAVAAAPDDARGLVTLSIAEGGAGNVPGSLDAARYAVRLAPQVWAPHYQLARSLLQGGDPGEALAAARRAVALAPNSASARNLVGACLQSDGDDAGARRAYSDALRLDPQDAYAMRNLASLELSAGRLGTATRAASAALALAPQDDRVRRRFGFVLHALVRQLNLVVALGGTMLGIAMILKAPYALRVALALAIATIDTWAFVRMTRHLPRGLRRPGRQSLRYLGWFVRLRLLLILAVTVAILFTALAPLHVTRTTWPALYPWFVGIVAAILLLDFAAAVGQEATR